MAHNGQAQPAHAQQPAPAAQVTAEPPEAPAPSPEPAAPVYHPAPFSAAFFPPPMPAPVESVESPFQPAVMRREKYSTPFLLEETAPRGRQRRRGVLWIVLLSVLAAAVGWLALREPDTVTIPAAENPAPGGPAAAPAPTPPEEVKPAIPSNGTGKAAGRALDAKDDARRIELMVNDMVRKIDTAKKAEDWLPFVAQPEKHRGEVEQFFEKCGGRLGAINLRPSGGKIKVLPSGAEERLFSLSTSRCPAGVILQVQERDGRAVMNWPLFVQSHDHLFDAFAKGKDASAPQWFHLLCQLAHDFELPPASRERWLCLQAQGSVGGATANVYINKDSPAGRSFGANLAWTQVYLVELLLRRMDVDGRMVNVVLDSGPTRVDGHR
jgi:hypothetical protein